MKKFFLLPFALCSVFAAQAQSCVSVQQVNTNYATNQITFDVKWGTCNNTNHLYRVWVFVDYRPVTNIMKGAWGRATIAATDKGTLVSANKGVWITGSANATQRVILTLNVIGDKFDWCAFAIDYPPNATMSSGVYTLRGTPPFTINGSTTLGATQTTYTGGCITSITDRTNNPEGRVTNPAFSAGSIPSTGQTICSGTAYSAINSSANASGGDSRITYRWLRNGTEIANTNSANYTPTQAGTYTRQAHDGTCNTGWANSSGSWVVTVNVIPGVPTMSGGGTQCGGTRSITATTGTNGSSIRWTDNNSTTASRTVGTGTYYAVSRSAAGCESSAAGVTVTINAVPGVPTMGGGGTQCGGTMIITATPDVSGNGIRWTDNNSAYGSRTVGSGTYYAVSRSAAGCESSPVSVTVTINPIPGVPTMSGGGTQCGGTRSITATTGTNGNGIRWTDNNSTTSPRSVGTGTYYAVSRSAAGCESGAAGVTVTINAVPGVPTMGGGGTQCGGTRSITATTGTGGNSIRWTDNNSTTASRTVGTGTYYAVSRSAAGCESSAAGVTVTIVGIPAVPAVTNNGDKCAGTAITFTASASGVTGYDWTGSVSGTGTSKTTATTAGAYSAQARSYYTASGVTCRSGYSGSSSANIYAIPTPSISSGTTSIQVNATTTWTGSPAGGTWGTANSSIATVSSGVVTGKAVGSTNITYAVTTNGCTGNTSRAITVTAPPGSSNWTNCSGFSYISNVANEGRMTWNNANTYCANKGMRLPTLSEFQCICSNKASLPGGYVPNYYYWSSTAGGSGYYTAGFNGCGTSNASPSLNRFVKCVK